MRHSSWYKHSFEFRVPVPYKHRFIRRFSFIAYVFGYTNLQSATNYGTHVKYLLGGLQNLYNSGGEVGCFNSFRCQDTVVCLAAATCHRATKQGCMSGLRWRIRLRTRLFQGSKINLVRLFQRSNKKLNLERPRSLARLIGITSLSTQHWKQRK